MSRCRGLRGIDGVPSYLESDSLGCHDRLVANHLCSFFLSQKTLFRVGPALQKHIYRDDPVQSPDGRGRPSLPTLVCPLEASSQRFPRETSDPCGIPLSDLGTTGLEAERGIEGPAPGVDLCLRLKIVIWWPTAP